MAITMKNLNDRTSALEGKASTTPITMKGLSDRLDNIEATAKDWAIVTLSNSGSSTNPRYNFDTKYQSYNFCILSGSAEYMPYNWASATMGISGDGKTISGGMGTGQSSGGFSGSVTYSKNTGYFSLNRSVMSCSSSIKVLFYK